MATPDRGDARPSLGLRAAAGRTGALARDTTDLDSDSAEKYLPRAMSNPELKLGIE